MRPQYDVFFPGDYFFDLIYTGLPSFPVLGQEVFSTGLAATAGASYITARTLHRLGARVGWAGCFGNDEYSLFAYELAQQEQIDLSLAKCVDKPYRRISTSIPFQGDRAFVTYVDPPPIDLQAFWLESMDRCDFNHLHLGGIMLEAELTPLVEVARARGATVSIDCQDMPALYTDCEWCKLLSMVDVFMPNAREALIISATSAVESALRKLMKCTKVLIVKDGANGAWIATGEEIIHAPAINAGSVVDTTGAGDSFNAGFLFGYVVEKAPLPVCARYGNICGGLSVTQVGGATAAPTYKELMEWFSTGERH
jgi:sugar/nucleoside kinase (ribokinase family)